MASEAEGQVSGAYKRANDRLLAPPEKVNSAPTDRHCHLAGASWTTWNFTAFLRKFKWKLSEIKIKFYNNFKIKIKFYNNFKIKIKFYNNF